jgi:hypothetical protein
LCLCYVVAAKSTIACGTELVNLAGYVHPAAKPLDAAAEKLWGFASESARHLREGQELVHADMALTVGIAAQLVTYLARPRKD